MGGAITSEPAYGWSEIDNPPNALWIQSAGMPLSLRHSARSLWAGVVIKPEFLDSALGRRHTLRTNYVVADDLLAHLLLSLVRQVNDEDPEIVHNSVLSQVLIRSFLLALGARFGTPARATGGIASYQLKKLRGLLEDYIAGQVSVEQLADKLGLSEARFAREFYRSVGLTPWDYVIKIRLDRACGMLRQGDRASDVAFHCGFADQAHFSRLL